MCTRATRFERAKLKGQTVRRADGARGDGGAAMLKRDRGIWAVRRARPTPAAEALPGPCGR